MFDDRPAFVQVIDYNNGIVDLDKMTVVIIDEENKSCNIILKKGGYKTMLKTVERVKAGWEEVYEKVIALEKDTEEKIRQQMAKELESIRVMKSECIEFVEIEVPDEEDVAEDSETVENAEASEEVAENGITF